MLFVLIPIAWLLVVMLVVAACRMAARADASPALIVDTQPPEGEQLQAWDPSPTATALTRRPSRPRTPLRSQRSSLRRRRATVHGLR